MSIYRSVDRATSVFRSASALKCADSCGECCFNSNVEVSELEMLPLAMELSRRQKSDEWYRKAEEQNFEGRCVFYSSSNGRGRCQVYAFRPLLCRLFGFSGNRDKHGRNRLVTCGIIKKQQPLEVEQVFACSENSRLEPPVMADFSMQVSSVDPDMASDVLPINTAFKKAVERVELNKKFRKKGWLYAVVSDD